MLIQSISGIRGVYEKDLTLDVVRRYALAFYQFLNKKSTKIKIVIGSDSRPSGYYIKREFLRILSSYDTELIDVDINTTPAIQLGVREYKADGGIIITASHNPPEYNGIKFLNNGGTIIEKKDFEEINQYFNDIQEIPILKPNFGRVIDKSIDLRQRYINFLCEMTGKEGTNNIKDLNQMVVLDPNGGAASVILKELFERIEFPVVLINNKLGEFKREIEPTEKSLAYLVDLLQKRKAHFAAGFDCDADRVEIILSEGTMLSGNHILALLFGEILSRNPHPEQQTIVVNDATSYLVKDVVEKYGAHYKEVEVGEINVVHEMYKVGAIAGGEGSSGGAIFPPSTCRDGVLALLLLLKLMACKQKSLKELIKELPTYFTLHGKLKCENDLVDMKNKLKRYFMSQHYTISETGDNTGGLKIHITDSSWIWYRMSKTEPGIFRIIVDSKDEQEAKRLFKEGIYIFNTISGKA